MQNEMRDRIVELIKQIQFDFDEECVACIENGYKAQPMLEEFFADHLIANGVIVSPMKLGQICFEPLGWRSEVDECRVSSITQKADGTFKIRLTNLRIKSVFEITPDKIGKTVFLTKEEAEKVLKERENNATQ